MINRHHDEDNLHLCDDPSELGHRDEALVEKTSDGKEGGRAAWRKAGEDFQFSFKPQLSTLGLHLYSC